MAGHLQSQTMSLIGSTVEWQGGRVKIKFDEMVKYDTHPIIAVAQGAHALYPVSGDYYVNARLGWPTSGIRGSLKIDLIEPTGLRNRLNLSHFNETPKFNINGEKIILPPISNPNVSNFNNYNLSKLNLAQTSHSGIPYIVFSGYWVTLPIVSNEKFPPFTYREKFIETWVDDAYNEWDWNNITHGARRSIRDINIYLAKYLLEKPQNLFLEKVDNIVTLNWDRVQGADGYIVYKSIGDNITKQIIFEMHPRPAFDDNNNQRIAFIDNIEGDNNHNAKYWVCSIKFVEKTSVLSEIKVILFDGLGDTNGNTVESEKSNVVEILNNQGRISGLVADAITNNPIHNANILVYDRNNNIINSTTSNNSGQYTANALAVVTLRKKSPT